jgi:hypothetical protein
VHGGHTARSACVEGERIAFQLRRQIHRSPFDRLTSDLDVRGDSRLGCFVFGCRLSSWLSAWASFGVEARLPRPWWAFPLSDPIPRALAQVLVINGAVAEGTADTESALPAG